MDDRTINAIEAIVNVFYLIEHHADDPASVRRLVDLVQPALATLVDQANEGSSSPA
jgi:hypothetical protein